MAKHNHKGRSKTGGAFVMLPNYLLDSPAWRALSTQARALYIELRRRYNGRNNGQIALSVRDGADLCRMNRDTVASSFKALESLGFVELATPGSFSRKVRHAAEWRLTTDICDATGAVPSKAFMRWRPEPDNPNQNTVPNQGLGGALKPACDATKPAH